MPTSFKLVYPLRSTGSRGDCPFSCRHNDSLCNADASPFTCAVLYVLYVYFCLWPLFVFTVAPLSTGTADCSFIGCFWLESLYIVLQAKDIESYSSDPAILALAEQFCTSCSVSVSNVLHFASF